eukprot:PhM_4_TR19116/c0_g1_i1/m.81101
MYHTLLVTAVLFLVLVFVDAHNESLALDLTVPRCRTSHSQKKKSALLHPSAFHALQTASTSDGITRSTSPACKDSNGVTCQLCCNSVCCEEYATRTDQFPAGIELWVPVRFISVTTATAATFNEQYLKTQIAQLNKDWASTKFFFYLDEIVHARDSTAASSCNSDPCFTSADCNFYKNVLKPYVKESYKRMNVVLCSTSYLGEASLPWDSAHDSYLNYVQVTPNAISGMRPSAYYGGGRTLVHEVGHYFGLLHTFNTEGQCDASGDYVSDTPTQKDSTDPSTACDKVLDTCTGGGADDTKNFMDYSADKCMEHFTAGQISRLQQSARAYFPTLYSTNAVQGTCSSNRDSWTLDGCACHDTTKTPTSLCKTSASATATPATSTPQPSTLGPVAHGTVSPPQVTPTSATTPPGTSSPSPSPSATIATPQPTSTPAPTAAHVACREATACNGGVCETLFDPVTSTSTFKCSCEATLGARCGFCPSFSASWSCQHSVAVDSTFRTTVSQQVYFPRNYEMSGLQIVATTSKAGEAAWKIGAASLTSEVSLKSPVVMVTSYAHPVVYLDVSGTWQPQDTTTCVLDNSDVVSLSATASSSSSSSGGSQHSNLVALCRVNAAFKIVDETKSGQSSGASTAARRVTLLMFGLLLFTITMILL